MNSYFFFGFHILKYLNVTFMCQFNLGAALINLKKLPMRFISLYLKDHLKVLIRDYILNINLKKF